MFRHGSLSLASAMTPSQTSFDIEDISAALPHDAFFGPAHLVDTIVLESAIDNIQVVDATNLSSAWRQMAAVSVEAALTGQPDVFEFANKHCLLFAAIRSPIKVDIPEWLDIRTLRWLGLPLHDKIVSYNSPIILDNPAIFTQELSEARRHECKTIDQDPPTDAVTTSAEKPPQNSEGMPSQEENPNFPTVNVMQWKMIGVVYVTMSSIPQEVHVGISILPPYRGRGYGMQACALAVQWAIETIDVHRVQARIMSSPSRESTQRLFTALGFAYEGIQRHAVTNTDGAWADITHMGIIDINWVIRKRRRAAPQNLWDELFERHQREREELLRWEAHEGSPRMRRTSSMETLRREPHAFWDSDTSSCADTKIETRSPSPALSTSMTSQAPPLHTAGWQDNLDLDTNPTSGWRDVTHPMSESETDELFSDAEWEMGDLSSDYSVASGEPVSRPLSAASSSSFVSVGTAATSSSGRI